MTPEETKKGWDVFGNQVYNSLKGPLGETIMAMENNIAEFLKNNPDKRDEYKL